MLDPIVKTIEVPCNQKKAFTVFLEQMDSWWPKGKFTASAMAGAPAKTISVDAQQGGKILEISADGKEYQWGTIKTYDPFGFFSMDFHIPRPTDEKWPYSQVDVTFTVLEDQLTRVELVQTNWEVFDDMAEGIRGGYDFGWKLIFEEAYKAACGS